MVTCSACGADVTNVKFCTLCGKAVVAQNTAMGQSAPPMPTCSRCSAPLKPGTVYCGECGFAHSNKQPGYAQPYEPSSPYGPGNDGPQYAGSPPQQPYYESPARQPYYAGPPPQQPRPYQPQPGNVYYVSPAPAVMHCPACHVALYPGTTHCPHCHLDLAHACSSGIYHGSVLDQLRYFVFGDHHGHHDYHHDYHHGHHDYHHDDD